MASGDLTGTYGKTSERDCAMFDGVDDYVEIPHNAAQLGANLSNGFTISAWINPRSQGEGAGALFGRILDKSASNTATDGFAFCVNTDATKIVFRVNVGTTTASAVASITKNIWQHVLVTISSGQLTNFYVNGVLSGTANQDLVQAISTITTTNVMKIGNRSSVTDSTFDGGIKSVKMWNRVLTAAEIANEYAGLHTGGGCIHYFKLNGDYADYGSVGVTATNSGSVPAIVDDKIAGVVKAQRTATGMSGAFMMCKGAGGQVINVAIQKT